MQTLNQSEILAEINDVATLNKKKIIRVLHVDDDPSILEVSKEILKMEGNFEIDNACCVDEAFRKFEGQTYDVVISDYEMPTKDGLEFLKELREQNNQIPFILFTGKGREEVAIKALNLGADGYHNKQGSPETVYGELAHSINIIVERYKAKKELKEHEIRFSKLSAQTPGMLFQFLRRPDGSFCVPFASDGIHNVFGCSPQDVQTDFSPIATVIVPEDLEKVLRSIEQSATQLSLWQCEYRVQLSGQKIRWFCGQSAPERLEDGSILWSGFNLDVTELKESEEKNLYLASIVEHSNDAIIGKSLDGVITSWNEAAERIYGYKAEEILGKSIQILAPPDQKKEILQILNRISVGEQIKHYETRRLRKDGTEIYVSLSISPIKNGTGFIIGASAIARDISERKKVEANLLKSQALFVEAESAGKIGGFEFDVNTLTQSWTDETFSILEIDQSRDEPIVPKGVEFINSEYRSMANAAIKRAIELGEPYDQEWEITTIKGNKRWVRTLGKANWENGKIKTISGSLQDITESKLAEEALKKDTNRIELLNEKLRVVGSLTRHDVGNKIMSAKTNLYLLRKRIGDNPDLVRILDNIGFALASSDQILDFSRLYERIGAEKPSEMSVFECFNQATVMIPNLGSLKIVNECQGILVLADSLLKQLFYNFIDNSLKHGEKVSQIRLHFIKEGCGVKIFYEDDGVGISEVSKPKIFNEGFTTGNGKGLGLFLIKKIIEVYGWKIAEEGESGKGVRFIISIPKVTKLEKDKSKFLAPAPAE